jgi:DHA1 family tetracycline resistance protein-like MFS transporter
LFFRVATGVCGGTVGIALAYIADVTEESERALRMNNAIAALFLGMTVGPIVGGLLERTLDYHWTCYCAAGVSFLNALLVFFFLPEPQRSPSTEPTNWGQVARSCLCPCGGLNPRALSVAASGFLQGLSFTSLEAIGVLHIADTFRHGDIAAATLSWSGILAGIGVVGLLVSLFVYGAMLSRLQRCLSPGMAMKVAIAIGGAVCAASFLLMGLATQEALFAAACLLFIAGDNVMGSSVQTVMTFVLDSSQFGKGMGTYTLCQNTAKAVGPLVISRIYDLGGRATGWNFFHALPWFLNLAAKLACVFACTLVRLNEQDKVIPEDGQNRSILSARAGTSMPPLGRSVLSSVSVARSGGASFMIHSANDQHSRSILSGSIQPSLGMAGGSLISG